MTKDITGQGIKCVKCGEYAEINHIIDSRGYGSMFDCITEPTTIPVCFKCDSKYLKQEWFDEEPVIALYCENYEHEGEILKFINSLDEETADNVLGGHYI